MFRRGHQDRLRQLPHQPPAGQRLQAERHPLPYEMARSPKTLVCGAVGTCLSDADLKGEFTGPWVQKYMKNGTGTTAENRMRILRLIENLSWAPGLWVTAPSPSTGLASPQAQRVMIARQGDIEGKKLLAKRIAHVKRRLTKQLNLESPRNRRQTR